MKGGAPAGSPGAGLPAGQSVPSGRLVFALCAALAVATIAVYAQTYRYGFIEYDDSSYVYENPMVKQGLTASSVAWAFTTFWFANWHPLTWLSHMVDYELFGLNPGAYHLVNVGLHLASTLVLFIVLVRVTRRPWRSAVVAGVFAVHPLHVESVAWIAERKDVLSAFLGLLALLLYVRYTERRTPWRYVPVVLALGLGLMAKAMLVTLPFVFLLVDVWPLKRTGWPPAWKGLRPLLVEKIPLFAMVAAASVVTFIAQREGGAVSGLARLPFGDRLATAAIAYVSYIGKALWPMKLSVMYPYHTPPARDAVGAAVILVVVTIAAIACGRTRPYCAVGWLWYLGMLVPVIGLVQVGAQSMADRYVYLPLVGLSLGVVWLVGDVVESRLALRRAAAVIGCVALVLLGVRGYVQASYWKSSQTLFERSLAATGRNHIMHKNLAVVFDHEGKNEEAMAQYREALAIRADYAEAHNGLALILDREGRRDEAVAHYEKALASQPDFAEAHNNLGALLDREGRHEEAAKHYKKALAGAGNLATVHLNLGVMRAKEGKRDEAMAHYAEALEIDPGLAEAHNNLGVILAGMGRHDEAASHYRSALESKPDYPEANANLGHELLASGRLEEAYARLLKALEGDKASAQAQADLGTLLAVQGRFEESREHLAESIRLAPDQADAHSNLSFVLQKLGRVDEAIIHCREALRLKPGSVDAHYNMGMALAAQGKRSEAAAEMARVLELNPGHAAAQAALGQLQGSK